MLKLLGFLKKHVPGVLIVTLILVAQAYCDLALPTYTSDIVDIGIQQGGIEDGTPEVLRKSTMDMLLMFLTEEEDKKVLDSYQLVEAGNASYIKKYPLVEKEPIYVLSLKGEKKEQEKEREELSSLLGIPMLIVGNQMQGQQAGEGMEENGYSTAVIGGADGPTSIFLAGKDTDGEPSAEIPDDAVLAMRTQVKESMGELSDSIVDQMAVQVIKQEYEAIGVDMEDLQMSYLWRLGRIMLFLSAIILLCAIVVGFIASRIGASVGMELRQKIFGNVLSFSNAEMDKFSVASLITRCTNDIQQVQMVTTMLLRMLLYAPIMGIGGIIKVAATDTGMEWIIVTAVAAVIGIVGGLMVVTMPKFKKMQKLVDRLNLVAREILTGLPVIRAFSREKHEEERFGEANRNLMKTQLFTNRVMSVMMPVMMLIMNLVSVAIVWFGAKGVDTGNLQVGDMMAFMVYTILIIMSFLMMTMMSIMLPRAGVAAERIREVIDTESSIKERETKKKIAETGKNGSVVSFENVSFHYGNAKEDVVRDITFTAKPGQTTAIIGSTGCGKSTLLHLLLRFYDVTGGRICVDGTDIRDLSLKELRNRIGFVPQKGVLFSGTIDSNIRYADAAITKEEMEKAAAIAQACEFIEEKPEKYADPIAQGGSNVSGGQKQRLSIARAIAKAPGIYLFDDSFSALDYKTDAALRKALREETGDSTVIIVAQRISTILHAEQIIVLDDGQIAGIGTHEELLSSCKAYQEIASSQLSEKELKRSEA